MLCAQTLVHPQACFRFASAAFSSSSCSSCILFLLLQLKQHISPSHLFSSQVLPKLSDGIMMQSMSLRLSLMICINVVHSASLMATSCHPGLRACVPATHRSNVVVFFRDSPPDALQQRCRAKVSKTHRLDHLLIAIITSISKSAHHHQHPQHEAATTATAASQSAPTGTHHSLVQHATGTQATR